MKDRVLPCKHYACEYTCLLGKEATFYRHCQICKSYDPKPGSQPARTDTRRQKKERIERKERRKLWNW